jgi:TPP-dependent indolepyruvate ferredoxin oxidoreductase alpha subunit
MNTLVSLPRKRLRPITPVRSEQDPAPRLAPVAIEERRCNRCGSCLKLACPAIEDLGGEALVIDEAVCTGCGLCVPLCRARAIGPDLRVLGEPG